jgi:hypothetical protein
MPLSVSLLGGFSISTGDSVSDESSRVNVISVGVSMMPFSPGMEGGCEIVITEDIDCGLPVSAQLPLSAASKKGDAKMRTSLCALSRG